LRRILHSYKFLKLPDEAAVALSVKVDAVAGTITINAARPVKGFVLSFDVDVTLSDNALDLIPGDERVITVKGLTHDTKVSWRCKCLRVMRSGD
jgi:beta-mannosidase